MGRDIKFRAWDKEEEKMWMPEDEGYEIGFIADFNHSTINLWDIECQKDIDCEIMQYTGLKDKNGREIYEGDIFKFDDELWESCYTSCGMEYDSWEGKNYGVIGYCNYSASYDFMKYKYKESTVEADLHENNNLNFAEFVQSLEIVGNIYENPELLEAD